jgi:hypothetical protein
MARGVKTGGGSRKGIPNRKTTARGRAVVRAKELADALGPHAFAGDALGLLQLVYQDGCQPVELRLDAARAAAPYERPRLSAVTANVEAGLTLEQLVVRSLGQAPAKPNGADG